MINEVEMTWYTNAHEQCHFGCSTSFYFIFFVLFAIQMQMNMTSIRYVVCRRAIEISSDPN